MNKEFSEFVRKRIRNTIIWKALWIALIMGVLVFFWLIVPGDSMISNVFLTLVIVTLLFILLITIPRWLKYYRTHYNYASKFAEALETKTEELVLILKKLGEIPFPKDVYWINFRIDPDTFKFIFDSHTTNKSWTSDSVERVRHEIESLIPVNESTITELKKRGWDAEANLDLSVKLIEIWITTTWNKECEDSKLRATVSIKGRSGYYNMKRGKWEQRALFS